MSVSPAFRFLALLGLGLVCGCHRAEDAATAPEVLVDVARVAKVDLSEWVEVYGTVEGEPSGGGQPGGAARLMAPSPSIVLAIPVREGERVAAGAVIARLDDRTAAASVARARTAVGIAEQQAKRQERLYAIGGVSSKAAEDARQQLAAARADLAAASAQLAQVRLTSPLTGVVSRIYVQPGQTVDPTTIVADIVNGGRLQVAANLPAGEVAKVAVGQAVEVVVPGDSQPVSGRVAFVSPAVDPSTDTALVRLTLSAPGLRMGQFVRARIKVRDFPQQTAVSRSAVYTDHDGRSTLALVRAGRAYQVPVRIVVRDGDYLGVAGQGVSGGAFIVTQGAYALPDGTQIQVQGGTSQVSARAAQ
ncbi:efflux RND transporter periplasmic adaptor subunit [Sphingobium estronivorans]|uniref:efflux RND transporter periplasmic adaptor subunit n=1 Tax=Sphingobium estronivorans TaxID=1577690 RepID=UPI0012396036|nr:efflux RND transporter periplasmic adaptor subunit [Sphingobium estronivorans]